MTPFSTEVRTLFRLLEDRQWHAWREIKERLAATVAPGKALRKYEERLTKRRDRGGHEPMPNELSEDDKILYGQRLLADAAMQGIKRRWLEVEHNAGGFALKMVRLKPGVEIPEEQRHDLGSGSESAAYGLDDDEADEDPEDILSGPTEVYAADDADDELQDYRHLAQPVHNVAQALAEATECPVCFQLVLNPERHAQWHEAMAEAAPATPPREEMALFSETEVRQIIAQEVGLQLDAFQNGFQQWLMERLADPEQACLLRSLNGQTGIPIQRS